ncbi:MAG: hypothetical protein QOD02_423, partial [Mycobacterium sp.]|nr:hypothetical protein [Mycobacterium sp.]
MLVEISSGGAQLAQRRERDRAQISFLAWLGPAGISRFDRAQSQQCVFPGPGSLFFKGFRESEDTEVVAVPADDLHADGQPVDCSGPRNRHCGV